MQFANWILQHQEKVRFLTLRYTDTIARYKNRNLKLKNRIGRLMNRNSEPTDTIGRYKNRNLRPRNRIGRLKNRNSNRTDTIGRFKNRNLASTDCIVRYNRKIESVSEDRSIGPFAHLCLPDRGGSGGGYHKGNSKLAT